MVSGGRRLPWQAVLIVLGLGVALAVVVLRDRAVPPEGAGPPPASFYTVPVPSTGPDGAFTLVSVGDINLAEDVLPTLQEKGGDYQFARLSAHLTGDALMGNLETVVLEHPTVPRLAKKRSIHIMRPEYLATLKAQGFTALALANNHIGDQGAPGILATLRHAEGLGIVPFGAGRNLADARRAVVFDAGHTKVAVLSVQDRRRHLKRWGWYAGAETPGCYPLNEAMLTADIAALHAQGFFVIVSVHWGDNYADETKRQQRELVALVRAGADLINGHGAHRGQGVRIVDGTPVVYSLGNFTFGSRGIYKRRSPDMRLSAIARYHWKDGALTGIQLLPIRTDNRKVKFQPRVAGAKQARREFEPSLTRYGLQWDRDDVGWYTLRL